MIIALVTYPTNPTNLICHSLAQRGCIIMLFKNGDFFEFVWKNIIRHIKVKKNAKVLHKPNHKKMSAYQNPTNNSTTAQSDVRKGNKVMR